MSNAGGLFGRPGRPHQFRDVGPKTARDQIMRGRFDPQQMQPGNMMPDMQSMMGNNNSWMPGQWGQSSPQSSMYANILKFAPRFR